MPAGPLTWLMLLVAVVGVSWSAPLSAATVAPVLAIVFWRNLCGASVSAVFLGVRREPFRFRWLSVLAGVLLAVHFLSWLTGLRLTSITASTALVTTTPAWTVALDLVRGIRVPRQVLAGVGLALVAVLAITGVDAAGSSRAIAGDLLSLLGALGAAGYVALGAQALQRTTTASHTIVAYLTCALAVVPFLLAGRVQVWGFSGTTWLQLAAITVGAQLFGHTVLNALLPRVGVTTVALATLLEVPGATLIAWAAYGRMPPAAVLPGTVLMLLGLVLVVRALPPGGQPAYASGD